MELFIQLFHTFLNLHNFLKVELFIHSPTYYMIIKTTTQYRLSKGVKIMKIIR